MGRESTIDNELTEGMSKYKNITARKRRKYKRKKSTGIDFGMQPILELPGEHETSTTSCIPKENEQHGVNNGYEPDSVSEQTGKKERLY